MTMDPGSQEESEQRQAMPVLALFAIR